MPGGHRQDGFLTERVRYSFASWPLIGPPSPWTGVEYPWRIGARGAKPSAAIDRLTTIRLSWTRPMSPRCSVRTSNRSNRWPATAAFRPDGFPVPASIDSSETTSSSGSTRTQRRLSRIKPATWNKRLRIHHCCKPPEGNDPFLTVCPLDDDMVTGANLHLPVDRGA